MIALLMPGLMFDAIVRKLSRMYNLFRVVNRISSSKMSHPSLSVTWIILLYNGNTQGLKVGNGTRVGRTDGGMATQSASFTDAPKPVTTKSDSNGSSFASASFLLSKAALLRYTWSVDEATPLRRLSAYFAFTACRKWTTSAEAGTNTFVALVLWNGWPSVELCSRNHTGEDFLNFFVA